MSQRILLIEDDAFLQQLYKEMLGQGGYECTVCGDGKQAFELITSQKWDLILLDVMIPSMDGFEIISTLVAKNNKPTCRIIFMTNLERETVDKEKLGLADDVWIKSNMTPPDFLEKVNSALRHS